LILGYNFIGGLPGTLQAGLSVSTCDFIPVPPQRRRLNPPKRAAGPFRIAVIADLHADGSRTLPDRLKRILVRTKALVPTTFALAGSGNPLAIGRGTGPFRRPDDLLATLGRKPNDTLATVLAHVPENLAIGIT
jgi:hypothetical protein